jgi:uncharacterized protein YndB with AHSA1/START domain
MSETADTREEIVFDCELEAAPETVWRALTRPELVAAWLGPNDIAPQVGRRFALKPDPDKAIDCEVLEAVPERRLSYRWREADDRGGLTESTVTFEVTPTPLGGSHLRLVHSGFRAGGAGSMMGAANANWVWKNADSRPTVGPPSPFDTLRMRATLTSEELLMLSLSRQTDFGPSHSQRSLKWAA